MLFGCSFLNAILYFSRKTYASPSVLSLFMLLLVISVSGDVNGFTGCLLCFVLFLFFMNVGFMIQTEE